MLNICAKNLQQGYLSPADFNTYINQAQISYMDFLKGSYQRYQLRRPVSVVEIGENQNIQQSLSPFIYGALLTVNGSTGIAAFPSDYEMNNAMWTADGYNKIRFVSQERLSSVYNSVIDPIATNPIYVLESTGFHFFPENTGTANLSYYRTPPPITWAYDLDVNGLPVYNAMNSQQPVWADTDMFQIIVRALEMAGVQIQAQAVIQYANAIKQGGQ